MGSINKKHDWTEDHNQTIIANKSDEFVEKLILDLNQNNLDIHKKLNLNVNELSQIYRWCLFVGVNLFIDRFLTVKKIIDSNENFNLNIKNKEFKIFQNTLKSIQFYYYDKEINELLLYYIYTICKKNINCDLNQINMIFSSEVPEGIQYNISNRNIFKNFVKKIDRKLILLFKPHEIIEDSGWARKLFPLFKCVEFYDFEKKNNFKIDPKLRSSFINSFENSFNEHIHIVLPDLSIKIKKKLAKLFSLWIISIIPLSNIEYLNFYFKNFQKLLKNWKIQFVHSFTGYIYNDFFKFFSILSKRKGSKLIGHAHGSFNYYIHYNSYNVLKFCDYYSYWGIEKTDIFSNKQLIKKPKIIYSGSTYLQKFKKFSKKKIDLKNFTILYPSGPLMNYSTDLEEISFKKSLEHRLKVIKLIELLFAKYSGLKILYKSFPGNQKNDPVYTHLKKYINLQKITLIDSFPNKYFENADMIMWDTICTGFSESLVSNKPTFVFNNIHEYNLVSKTGKQINDLFIKSGIQFFELSNSLENIENIINGSFYNDDSQRAIKLFLQHNSYPVSTKTWKKTFYKKIYEK